MSLEVLIRQKDNKFAQFITAENVIELSAPDITPFMCIRVLSAQRASSTCRAPAKPELIVTTLILVREATHQVHEVRGYFWRLAGCSGSVSRMYGFIRKH